jgi:hypothetical protein
MRSKRTQNLLARLNRQVPLLQFIDDSDFTQVADTAIATYFGFEIHIGFPNSKTEIRFDAECQPYFFLRLAELEDAEFYDYLDCDFFNGEFTTLKQVVAALGSYLQSRPFTIVKQQKDIYTLLDPNGHLFEKDISLKQAKSLCYQNFRM